MTIAEVLADRLTVGGLTQQDAAERIGVRQSAVSRWLSGKDAPKDEHVPALVKFTGLRKAQVLEAIHEQRVATGSTVARIRALEAEMSEVRDELRELVELLREPHQRGP